MSGETPLEIVQLRERLRQDITGRLAEITSSSLEEKERNFFSKGRVVLLINVRLIVVSIPQGNTVLSVLNCRTTVFSYVKSKN